LSNKQSPPDPQLRQQVVAFVKKFDDASNNNDAANPGRALQEDTVEVMGKGPIYGREAIEKHYADMFQKMHFSSRSPGKREGLFALA
jgi:ketosteroid isomerase-like protein